jgi:hypothetical protein
MKYKYSSKMHISFRSAVKRYTKILFHSIFDIFASHLLTHTQPVFVVGCGNSGTTLVATILSRHLNAFPIGYESSIFFPTFGLHFSKKMSQAFDLLAKQNEKSFFLEKTPKHALCLKRIFKILPQAKIVYVIRDVKDNTASLKKRYGNINVAIDRWVTDNRPALYWQSDPRVFLVKYEDLVISPTSIVSDICQFLEIPFSQEMLDSDKTPYHHFSDGNMSKRAKQVSKPIHDNTGKWTNTLTADDIDQILKRSSLIMKELGYLKN